MNQNLEALIEDHARTMVEQMVQAAGWAESEEDIRHAVNTQIDEFIKKADLSVRGRHEYGLAGGRIDSKYGGVVIEYKAPKGPGRISENKDAPGVKAVVKQIDQRFRDLQAAEHVGMERILGVGCDGDTFVFVRMRGAKIDAEVPQPVTAHTVERLLRAIVSLGARGLSFTPENLAACFGSEGQSAQEGVRSMHELIRTTDSPKAQTFFRQWQILFGEVCGYDIHGQNAKVRKLAEHYRVPDPNPAELLFAVHTYYAIFTKLLAAEIVATFSPLGTSTLKTLIAAPTSAKLRGDLRKLEQGGIWTELGIHNFLEGDLFAWYLDAWNDGCADAVRAMTRALDRFDPTTLSVDPAESRDLLKQLYQQLFPKSVRHDLGEYYTPDWLAELVLDELGYDGDPDKRLLDPACGSGTFLVMALNRVKTWYDEHRQACGFGEDELLQKILRNIIGFDLNPLAVMAARTNYLMAIRDLLRHADTVELPVYLCDSIMTPSEYGDLFTAGLANARQLKTSAGDFNIPSEVASSRDHIGRYADTIEFCIRNRYSPEEFLERCEAEAIPATERELHKTLYRHLQQLDADNKNGVWARIIKNAFAPLFVGKVDYVAGNPPWVNWENLPNEYRQSTAPLWQEYDLFRHRGYKAKLGGGKDDVSILMTYVAHDTYLEEGGRLGFVITQSVFKTKGGGEGFRSLRYRTGETEWFLRPSCIHDLSAFQPFDGATNRTAVATFVKQSVPFEYPVKYILWRKAPGQRVNQAMSLAEVEAQTARIPVMAEPVDPSDRCSPWMTAPEHVLHPCKKMRGVSEYKARKGVYCPTNAVYWLVEKHEGGPGRVTVTNLADTGKKKVQQVTAVVEDTFVHSLLRGKDVGRWHATAHYSIILPQDPDTPSKAVPVPHLKRSFPRTYSYFRTFEADLRSCALLAQFFDPERDPFYSSYDVGSYTYAPYKVVWKEICAEIEAAVVVSSDVTIIPDHKLVSVGFETLAPAYLLAGILNSSPVRLFVRIYSLQTSISGHVFDYVRVPSYAEAGERGRTIAALAEKAHAAAAKNDTERLANLEAEIDEVAASLWGITPVELEAIHELLAEM